MAKTTKSVRLPPLPVGLGVYLSTASTSVIPSVPWWAGGSTARRPAAQEESEATQQLGVLLASGLIVGTSWAWCSRVVVFTANPYPIGIVGDSFNNAGLSISGIAFSVVTLPAVPWTEKLA